MRARVRGKVAMKLIERLANLAALTRGRSALAIGFAALLLLFASNFGAQSLPFEAPVTINAGGLGPQSHSMAVAADGRIYVAYDLRTTIFPGESRTVFVARSTDSGKTWANVSIVSGFTRFPRIAVG